MWRSTSSDAIQVYLPVEPGTQFAEDVAAMEATSAQRAARGRQSLSGLKRSHAHEDSVRGGSESPRDP